MFNRFLLVVMTVVLSLSVSAQDDPQPVSIGIGAVHAIVYLNFDVAQALGYFEDEGLDADLQYFSGGSDAVSALLDESVDFIGAAADHTLDAQAQGEDMQLITEFLNQACVTLLVRSDLADEITSIEDMRGHTVGVTSFGSTTDTLVTYLATNAGVSEDEYEKVEVGTSTLAAAFEAETVDLAMGVTPYSTELLDADEVTVLVDLCSPEQAEEAIGGSVPFTGLLTRGDVIADDAEITQKVVNAIVKAQLFITSSTPEEIVDILPEDVLGGLDPELYAQALETNLQAFNLNGGLIEADGWERLAEIRITAGTLDPDAEIDFDALYNNQFVLTTLETPEDD